MTKRETLGKILYGGLVPVIVQDRLPVMKCLEQVLTAGLEAVEISCRHPEALELIREAKREFPELVVGAATLVEAGRWRDFLNTRQPLPSIEALVDAGADFLVSMLPFRADTYDRYRDDLAIISGVNSPGEAARALDWGANLLKFVNPHLVGGPDFFKEMDPATYHSFPYLVSGGIRPNIAPGYIEAGVLAVGAGLSVALGPEYAALQSAFDGTVMVEKLREYIGNLERARGRHQEGIPYATKDPVAIQEASGRCLNV